MSPLLARDSLAASLYERLRRYRPTSAVDLAVALDSSADVVGVRLVRLERDGLVRRIPRGHYEPAWTVA